MNARILAAFVSIIICGNLQAQQARNPAIEREIMKTLDAQVAAWNAGDIRGFMDGYVKSDELRFASGGVVQRGWQVTLDRYLKRYDSPGLMGQLTFSGFQILQLSDDTAEVFGKYHLSRGGDVGDASGLFTLLMKKTDGRWLVFHDHTSSSDPPTDEPATDEPAADEPAAEDPTVGARVQAVLEEVKSQLAARQRDRESVDRSDATVAQLSASGDLSFFTGNFDDAVLDYEAMVVLDPSLETSHWRLGIALFYAGRPADGAKVFDKYHSFDQVDRENGIWRYLCHHRASGQKKAREQLLKYEKDDRPPFPHVYQLFEGSLTVDEVLQSIAADLPVEDRNARLFYAHLYAGLNAAVNNDTSAAKRHLRQVIINPWPRTAGYGPRYMWHVGRVHYQELVATTKKESQ
jgi:lipoprotein NlpI